MRACVHVCSPLSLSSVLQINPSAYFVVGLAGKPLSLLHPELNGLHRSLLLILYADLQLPIIIG